MFSCDEAGRTNRDGTLSIDLVVGEHLADQLKEFALGIKTEMINR